MVSVMVQYKKCANLEKSLYGDKISVKKITNYFLFGASPVSNIVSACLSQSHDSVMPGQGVSEAHCTLLILLAYHASDFCYIWIEKYHTYTWQYMSLSAALHMCTW